MIEGWKAKAQLFEIVQPELEPEAIEFGEIRPFTFGPSNF
jgi:hypothetical protein